MARCSRREVLSCRVIRKGCKTSGSCLGLSWRVVDLAAHSTQEGKKLNIWHLQAASVSTVALGICSRSVRLSALRTNGPDCSLPIGETVPDTKVLEI